MPSCPHSRPVRALLGPLLTAGLLVAAPAPQDDSPPAPRALALLVGICDYAAPPEGEPLGHLAGPANDVARARQLLVEHFGFAADEVEVLIGAQATHEAIVTTFDRHLIRRAGPRTKVVFWFSGHGSRVPDASREDRAPRDEDALVFDDTLIAYDSRAAAPAGSYDISDDELHSLLLALRAEDVVVVTDCCHSGGVLRGGREAGVREGDAGDAPLDVERIRPFWPLPAPPVEDDVATDLPNVVQIAACGALEQAGEIDTAIGTYGTLSWFLTRALGDADAQTSWAEVAAVVRARVAGRGTRPTQIVQAVGPVERSVFGGRARPLPPGFQVDAFGTDNLWVGAGAIHGIGPRAELQIVDLEGAELGTATVVRVSATSCVADWTGPGARPRAAMRARPRTFGELRPPLRIALAEGVDAAVAGGSDIADVVSDADTADAILAHDGAEFVLRDAAGAVLRGLGGDRDTVAAGLLREHYFRSLWQGIEHAGRFPLRLSLEPATDSDLERYGAARAPLREIRTTAAGSASAVVGASALDPGQPTSGALVRLRVHNLGDRALHIAIVSCTEAREINVVYGRNEQNVVGPGESFSKCVWVGSDPHWPAERSMVDRYIVVATPRFADFLPFESAAPRVRSRGSSDGMPPFLREALGGARTRGPEMDEGAWGLACCDLQIVRPEVLPSLPRPR